MGTASREWRQARPSPPGGDDPQPSWPTTSSSFYIAAGLRNIVYTIAPQRIIVGGGVAKMPGLLGQLRRALRDTLARYPGLPEHDDDDFVVPPGLGDHAGIAGALVLAELALHGG